MNRSSVFGLAAVVVFAAGSPAQDPAAANRAAIKKLDYLVGKWTGEATITLGPAGKTTVKQTEDVQLKLDGTVLLVEGTGRGQLPMKAEEGVVFNALALVSYDAATKKYSINAHTKEGRSTTAELKPADKGFEWGFTDPQRGTQVRYTVTMTEKGEWHEIGDFSPDGKAWTRFFEMTLTKAKGK
jgi:hypothetical protein